MGKTGTEVIRNMASGSLLGCQYSLHCKLLGGDISRITLLGVRLFHPYSPADFLSRTALMDDMLKPQPVGDGMNTSQVSWLLTIYSIPAFFMTLIGGPLLDTFGAPAMVFTLTVIVSIGCHPRRRHCSHVD